MCCRQLLRLEHDRVFERAGIGVVSTGLLRLLVGGEILLAIEALALQVAHIVLGLWQQFLFYLGVALVGHGAEVGGDQLHLLRVDTSRGDLGWRSCCAADGAGTGGWTRQHEDGATTQVIFDVTGYFAARADGSTYTTVTPARVLDSAVTPETILSWYYPMDRTIADTERLKVLRALVAMHSAE